MKVITAASRPQYCKALCHLGNAVNRLKYVSQELSCIHNKMVLTVPKELSPCTTSRSAASQPESESNHLHP